ncbi:MAG: hypothetical protein IT436_08780 [Phycisphaerales bacterium]|nr:hypothetical protein [Phycisphaerales bacterium]
MIPSRPSLRLSFCAGLALASTTAFAGPVTLNDVSARFFESGGQQAAGLEGQAGGYTPREFPGGSVLPGDQASMSLTMPGGQFINEGGEKKVTRAGAPISIGKNRNGVGNILAAWDEIFAGDTRYIQALWQTDNGEDILPLGAPSFFWGWHLGLTDPVEFNPFITNVEVKTATLALSRDSGASFFTLFSIKGGLPNPASWDGKDPGIFQSSAGNGINLILALYEIDPVPAPAALPAFALAGLAAARRRR